MKTLLILFLSACMTAPQAAQLTASDSEPAPTPPKFELFDRVVVIGASLSAGFGLERENKAEISLADIFDATINAKHGRVSNQAQPTFAFDPEGYGQLIVDATKALKPTLVIAIDFPFWFAYGNTPNERRLSRLKAGLKLMDGFDCPILIGDFPNLAHAVGGGVLSKSQVPGEAQLLELNRAVDDWIAKGPNRHLIKLSELATAVQESKDLPYGTGWKRARLNELTQADKLHPTLLGTSMIAVMSAELLLKEFEELPTNTFDLNVESIAKRVQSAN
ncbi:MAG: hypothetical protein ACI8TQ_001490 [Planctomycetota bacterium]|jgi:hypothetical protein